MEKIDLKGKSWARYWAEEWKPHVCPASLLPGLLEDAANRGAGPTVMLEGTDEVGWDPGGMMMMDRTYQELELDGATFEVATENFELFYDRLKRMPLRKFSGGEGYYKIHGHWSCQVFTPDQRERLLKWCESRMEEVRVLAKKEDEEFVRRLGQINQGQVNVVSHRDPSLKIEQKPDGSVSVKKNMGPLSGSPNDAKN